MSAELTQWGQGMGVFGAEILLLVGAAALLERFHRSPHWARAVWQCGLICVAGLSVAELAGLAPRLATRVRPVPQVERPPISGVLPRPENVEPSTVSGQRVLEVPSALMAPSLPAREQPPVRRVEWLAPRILARVWGAVACLLLGYVVLARWWLALRLSRLPSHPALTERLAALRPLLCWRRTIRVICSDTLVGPIAFGFWRPAIAVPRDFEGDYSERQQQAILLHELAHVAQRDPFWHLAADCLTALLWWHPGMWWARRRFLEACETAADDTVRLLPDGAAMLASSLVQLGTRLRRGATWPQAAAQGAAFRSGLGRRVERLITLPSPAHPRRSLLRLTRWIGPTGLVAGVIVGSAWARPNPPERHTNMKKATLAAASLLVAMNTTAAQEPVPSAPATAPVRQTTRMESGFSNRGAQTIQRKLETCVLESVEYDALPLGEVVKHLIHESARLDPDRRGVNFVFQTQQPPAAPSIDPATGLPVPGISDPVDLPGVIIKIEPALKNVAMLDVLDAMTRVADRPICYTITDYAVVIRLRESGTAPSAALAVDTFTISPEEFFRGAMETFGVECRMSPSSVLQADLKRLLTRLGVDMEDPGKSVFYNPKTGVLMARLFPEELAIVEAAVRTIGGATARQGSQGPGTVMGVPGAFGAGAIGGPSAKN